MTLFSLSASVEDQYIIDNCLEVYEILGMCLWYRITGIDQHSWNIITHKKAFPLTGEGTFLGVLG